MKLQELQKRFVESLLQEREVDPLLLKHINDSNNSTIPVNNRFSCYRNNFLYGNIKALRHTFSVCNLLVGEKFFDKMAGDYVLTRIPTSYSFNDSGADFHLFIAQYPWASHLIYLSDVARLEWVIHQLLIAKDDYDYPFNTFRDFSLLQQIPENQYADIRFQLNSVYDLFSSAFPVDKIWAHNQGANKIQYSNSEKIINLDEGGCHLFIYRKNYELYLDRLSEIEWHLLKSIDNGFSLAEIIEYMKNWKSSSNGEHQENNATETDFSNIFSKVLPKIIMRGFITGFSVRERC